MFHSPCHDVDFSNALFHRLLLFCFWIWIAFNFILLFVRALSMGGAVVGWRDGATGKAFGLAISRSRVQILLEATLRNNLRQVVYTYVSLSPSSKTYNLVPAKGR